MNLRLGSIAVIAVVPVIMASSCQAKSTMQRVRDVHMSVRAAFVAADEFVAPRFEMAAGICLDSSDTELEADQCMGKWLELDHILSLARESIASLEGVYENIDKSEDGEASWQYWIMQVLAHGRAIIRILVEVDIGDSQPIINQMKQTLDGICNVVRCEGGG